MNLITPQLKDAILNELIESCTLDTMSRINRCDLVEKLHTSKETITSILHQFARIGFCTTKDYGIGCDFGIILYVEAHDMVRRGGFVAQEEVLKQELEKLVLDIKELKNKRY